MWNEFNIKTFPAETIVYRNGVYQPEISTLPKSEKISSKYDLPIHIIYIGKISGENTLNINLDTYNQPVFLSINTENNLPAFLNIFIKNAGKNSEIRGHIILKNSSELSVNIIAEHKNSDTGILLQTKIVGEKNSFSKITGTAIIDKNCKNTKSDIRFGGLATDTSAKIIFTPKQKISSIPEMAEHSAYMFHISDIQDTYLRESGLSGSEVKKAMIEAFINDFNLF
jgi:hypothetical protein